MPDSNYRIYPDGKDTLVYDEGDGRTLRFNCDLVEPFQVYVPNDQRWVQQTPDWAHERRQIVLDRLRAAKIIICEEAEFTRTIYAPDGTFRIESYYEMDERGYLMRWVRVLGADEQVLLHLNDANLSGSIGFPGPGMVTIPFNLHGRSHQIGINVRDRTFWFHPTDDPQPLDCLAAALAERLPRMSADPLIRPRLRSILGSVGLLAGSLLFVAGGIWQSLAGRTSRDRWIGILCTIFFGLCAAMGIIDLRRWHRRRRT